MAIAIAPAVRELEQNLVATLHNQRHELPIRTLCKLLELRFQKLQTTLLQCAPNEFLAVQVEARVIQKLLVELTAPQ
jgi:hypothetical protein